MSTNHPRTHPGQRNLSPGFPWTTIAGKHYWDAALVSNSPLDQVVEIGGLTGKNVYVVNLWLEKRALPHSIPEVMARRDEIVRMDQAGRKNCRSVSATGLHAKEVRCDTDPSRVAALVRVDLRAFMRASFNPSI